MPAFACRGFQSPVLFRYEIRRKMRLSAHALSGFLPYPVSIRLDRRYNNARFRMGLLDAGGADGREWSGLDAGTGRRGARQCRGGTSVRLDHGGVLPAVAADNI